MNDLRTPIEALAEEAAAIGATRVAVILHVVVDALDNDRLGPLLGHVEAHIRQETRRRQARIEAN